MIAVRELDLPSARQADALADKLLDDQIQESEMLDLNRLLMTSDEARRVFIERMLLHAELFELIAKADESSLP